MKALYFELYISRNWGFKFRRYVSLCPMLGVHVGTVPCGDLTISVGVWFVVVALVAA